MKKKVIIIVAVLIGIILTGSGVFLYKVGPTKNEDGSISLKWWPGVDFSFTVYEDYVRADRWADNNVQELVVPDVVFQRPVKELGERFTMHRKQLEKVIISKNVEIIRYGAFKQCDNLKSVEGGENVTYIGEEAFQCDYALETVEIGKKVTYVGTGSFRDCKTLRSVSFGEQLEKIEHGAFFNCESLTSIVTSDKLEYIGLVAFRDSGLEEIYIPETVSEIEKWAFLRTPWLEKQQGNQDGFVIVGDGILLRYTGNEKVVKIPEGTRVIGNFFNGNEGVEEIFIPESVEEIKETAFMDVKQPLKVYIPETVTRIGKTVSGLGSESSGSINYMGENRDMITIVTTEGSEAHQHAQKYNIKYEIVEEMPEY